MLPTRRPQLRFEKVTGNGLAVEASHRAHTEHDVPIHVGNTMTPKLNRCLAGRYAIMN